MSRSSRIVLAILMMLSVGALSAKAQRTNRENAANEASHPKASNNIYIVQMSDAPAVSYTGGVPGLRATKPKGRQKIDPESPEVVSYVGYLSGRHDQALRGNGRKVRDYAYTFNGFAAELTPEQASALKSAPGVLSVTKDELQEADTATTPTFLGLNAPGGLWERLGGINNAGEDIIIGVVDSGIWPESESFSDRTGVNGSGTQDGKLSYQHMPIWHGKCHPGEQFTASNCNQKLIGAYHFNVGWGGDAGLKDQRPYEFASPRDFNGHGTHTSSTAGGNSGVKLPGALSVFGAVNGIAPRARVAMYKALWHNAATGSANGFTSDLVAAIDQAVADGVDVINYSISGTQTNFVEPVQVAFLNAAAAGIFVSASAGNSGPSTSTVAHPSPWLTTVAAGTHNRNGEGHVTIGSALYMGASYATAVSGTLVDAKTSGLAGADVVAASRCYSATFNGTPVLDPAKVAGKIVLCDRGNNALVDKSQAVKDAGGIGMVLTNVAGGATTLLALVHSVPTVHVAYSATDYDALHSAAGSGLRADIAQATILLNVPAPSTADFSSRGPLLAGSGDLLKPDVMAPGVDILASVAPPGNSGASFSSYQGTSMSAPHVTGMAALFKQLHPDWSPMMIKSALMTSAGDVLDGPNTNSLVIFRQGAGHVTPNRAMDPGLVFDSNVNDWFAFLCGATTAVHAATCSSLGNAGYSFDRSDLNLASIAIGDLAGTQKVTRRVTNVGQGTATYTPSYTGMGGLNVSISPASLTIAPGQTKTFTVTFTRTTATLNAYSGGQLTWTDGTHNVRIPMVVRPITLVAPVQVSGTGTPITYPVTFGFSGPFTATPRGLIAATLTPGTVTDDPADSFNLTGQGVTKVGEFVVPAGTTYARFSLFDTDVTPASDIDLYVYRKNPDSSLTLVVQTGGSTSNEEANLPVNPTAGTYVVYAHGFQVPGTANFTLFSWILGNTNAGNMSVSAPPTGSIGGSGNIALTFTGLAPGTRYLGSVSYGGATGMPNPTIVRVDQQ